MAKYLRKTIKFINFKPQYIKHPPHKKASTQSRTLEYIILIKFTKPFIEILSFIIHLTTQPVFLQQQLCVLFCYIILNFFAEANIENKGRLWGRLNVHKYNVGKKEEKKLYQ